MNNNKYHAAMTVITLLEKERPGSKGYNQNMREYLLKVIEIRRANDPSPRAGCGYSHPKYNSTCEKTGSPVNDRADDYYEHGSH